MHKKKIQALVVAGLLTVGIIGGTLAWFTSQDKVTNIFNTGSVDNPELNAGIDVDETFKGPDGSTITPDGNGNATYNKPVLPGDKFTKEVWVDSEANYDQFVRARIEKSWKLGTNQTTANGGPELNAGDEVTHYAIVNEQTEPVVIYSSTGTEEGITWKELDYRKIQLEFENANFSENTNTDTWFAPANFNGAWETANTKIGEWYYYNQILQEKGFVEGAPATDKTANILESVTFKAEDNAIDNVYKTLRFDVAIKGESVQASNNAAENIKWDLNVPAASIQGYKTGATVENNGTK